MGATPRATHGWHGRHAHTRPARPACATIARWPQIPCYNFGTNDLYYRPFGPRSLLARLSSVAQVSLVPWCGRWYVPFSSVPFKVPVLTVIGDVFPVPHAP